MYIYVYIIYNTHPILISSIAMSLSWSSKIHHAAFATEGPTYHQTVSLQSLCIIYMYGVHEYVYIYTYI